MEEIKKEKEETKKEANILDPMEQIRLFGRGGLKLEKPIQDGENTVKELKWDFLALTGSEYVEALDMDRMAQTSFRITSKQALCLFAAAAAKATAGLDARDIRERMGVLDAAKAVQVATVFFTASSRAGNGRMFEVS